VQPVQGLMGRCHQELLPVEQLRSKQQQEATE